MTDLNNKPSAHPRFNNLREGDTLDRYDWFELVACRTDENEGAVVQCEARCADFWGIYGRTNEGTAELPEYLATAIHDARTALEAVRIARQIAIETGKGFVAGDTTLGHFPTCTGIGIWPVTQFSHIADELKHAIWDDLESTIAPEDRHRDDDDTHPLAPLRDAFAAFADYPGSIPADPYTLVTGHTTEQSPSAADREVARHASLTLTFYKLTTDSKAGLNSVIFTDKLARDDALLQWSGTSREDWQASNLAHDLDAFVTSKTDVMDRFKSDQVEIDIAGLITVNQAWVHCKDKPGTFGNLYDPDTVMNILEDRPDPVHHGAPVTGFDPDNPHDRAAVLAWCEQEGPDFEDQISELVCKSLPSRTAAYAALADKVQAEAAEEEQARVRKIEMRCTSCGSTGIGSDASARWDPDQQGWVLMNTYDDKWCISDTCDGAEISVAPFDIETGEKLRQPPGSCAYLPKAEADALWKAEHDRWSREHAERAAEWERDEAHAQQVADTNELLAAAHDEIYATSP